MESDGQESSGRPRRGPGISSSVLVIIMVAALTGCSAAQHSAMVGGILGAVGGAMIGGDGNAALAGAGVGALGGYMIGNEVDKARARETIVLREPAAAPGYAPWHHQPAAVHGHDLRYSPIYHRPPPPTRVTPESASSDHVYNFPPHPGD